MLDMNLDMFKAYVEGYQEHLFDMQCLAVHQGYWAGYFQSKKPKKPNQLLEQMIRDHTKEKNANVPKPEVDIDRIMRLDKKRMEYLAKHKGK